MVWRQSVAEVTELSDAQIRFIEYLITPMESRAELGFPPNITELSREMGYDQSTLYRWKTNESFKKEWDRRLMLAVGNPERVTSLMDRILQLALDGSSKHAEIYLKMAGKLQQGQVAVTVEVADASKYTDEELAAAIARTAKKEIDGRHLSVVQDG